MAFEIALLNPVRFIDTADINEGFDGNFAIEQILSYQNPLCYFQKWQNSDVLRLQMLADEPPGNLVIRTADIFDREVVSVPWAELTTLIVGQTFKVYELVFNFAALPEGRYYARVDYVDTDLSLHPLISEPWDVRAEQPNTTLLRYTNSENNYNVVFETKIEFQFRAESAVKDYTPGTDRNVYIDQEYNPTQLSAVPYRKFKFYIGYGQGVPAWVFDKIVQILAVDQVTFNRIAYQVSDGAEYETELNDDKAYIGGSIEVNPVDNNFKKYKTIVNNNNTFKPVQQTLEYLNQTGNLVIAGKFDIFSDLEKIIIRNRGAAFELLVGITLGGAEVGRFQVDEAEQVFTIEYLFPGTANLFLTIPTGSDCDIWVCYKQLNTPEVPLAPAPVTNTFGAKGTVALYVEVNEGDLELHWDTNTGIGRNNTAYAGWVWMDGRNGTEDMSLRSPIGFDSADDPKPGFGIDFLNAAVGTDQFTIAKANLPAEGIGIEVKSSASGEWRTGSGSGKPLTYVGGKGAGTAGPDLNGTTKAMGSGTAIEFVPKGRVSLFIQKRVD